MKYLKSHFQFSNQQRNGIFLLVAIIVIAQCVYFFVDFSSEDDTVVNGKYLRFYIQRIHFSKTYSGYSNHCHINSVYPSVS